MATLTVRLSDDTHTRLKELARHRRISVNKSMEELSTPLPLLTDQHRIVAKVDELMAVYGRLEVSLARGDATRGRLAEAMLRETLASEKGCQVTLR